MKKTMKSAMKAVALMMMATVMSLGMTSCDNEDDNKSTDTAMTGAETLITITPTTDAKDIAETTLEYTDENGKTQTKTAMGGLLTATVKVSKLPATIDITVKQTSLSGAPIVKDSYTLGANLKADVTGYRRGIPSGHQKTVKINCLKKVSRNEVPDFFKATHVAKKTLTISTNASGSDLSATLKDAQ